MDMSHTTNTRRREARDSLFLLAGMRMAGQAETLRVKIRNLSKGGMMAECPVRAVCGEPLTIDLRNVGWISGRVSWVVENRFGVVFDREIDCKAVRQPDTTPSEVPYARATFAASEPPPLYNPGNLRRV